MLRRLDELENMQKNTSKRITYTNELVTPMVMCQKVANTA